MEFLFQTLKTNYYSCLREVFFKNILYTLSNTRPRYQEILWSRDLLFIFYKIPYDLTWDRPRSHKFVRAHRRYLPQNFPWDLGRDFDKGKPIIQSNIPRHLDVSPNSRTKTFGSFGDKKRILIFLYRSILWINTCLSSMCRSYEKLF